MPIRTPEIRWGLDHGTKSAAPNANDYAIVVGINSYPGLVGEDGQPKSLDGPVNDALGIKEWLLDPDGGGLEQANVICLCTPKVLPAGAPTSPAGHEIKAAFKWVVDRVKQARKEREADARRLYVYMSGHGFSPNRDQACLIAADFEEEATENVFVTECVNSLIKCKHFDNTCCGSTAAWCKCRLRPGACR